MPCAAHLHVDIFASGKMKALCCSTFSLQRQGGFACGVVPACRPSKAKVHSDLGPVCFLGKQIPRVWQHIPSPISSELCFPKSLTHFLLSRCKPWEQPPSPWVGVIKFYDDSTRVQRQVQPEESLTLGISSCACSFTRWVAHCTLLPHGGLPVSKVRRKACEITNVRLYVSADIPEGVNIRCAVHRHGTGADSGTNRVVFTFFVAFSC